MRAFVALTLPVSLRARVAAVRNEVVAGLDGVRPVETENLHLTLKFLGDLSRADVAEAKTICRAAAASVERLAQAVEVGGLGVFPSKGRPRVVWVGVSDPDGRITALHWALDRGLGAIGVRGEAKGYTPHVTIARVRDRRGAFGLVSRLEEIDASAIGSLSVGVITLMMSDRKSAGATYSILGEFPVGGGE